MAVGRVNVKALLALLKIDAKQRGRRWHACCPAHEEKTPSWGIIDDPGDEHHGSHKCFGCGFKGGPWELAARVWGCSLQDAGARLRSIFTGGPNVPAGPIANMLPRIVMVDSGLHARGVRLPAGVIFPERVDQWRSSVARDYLLETRGVPAWQIERWGLGYATEGRQAFRIVVPVWTRGIRATFVARAFIPTIPKHDSGRREDGAVADRALFGEPAFTDDDTCVVVENVWSAMAFERDGVANACALIGSEVTAARSIMLSRFRTILVATDPDAAGEKAFCQLVGQLGRDETRRIIRVPLDCAPDDATPEQRMEAIERARKHEFTPSKRLFL